MSTSLRRAFALGGLARGIRNLAATRVNAVFIDGDQLTVTDASVSGTLTAGTLTADALSAGTLTAGALTATDATVTGTLTTTDVNISGTMVLEPGSMVIGLPIAALPPPIQSIANLVTVGGELIYTTAVDTYDKSPLSALGRTFVGLSTVAAEQNAMLITPGVYTQPLNATLSAIAALNAFPADSMIYSTAVNSFSPAPITALGRALVGDATESDARTTIAAVGRASPLPAVNTLALHDGSHGLAASGITAVGNSLDGALLNVTALGTVSASTVSASTGVSTPAITSGGILTVDGTGVSSAKWPFVASMNQHVATTSTPQFTSVTLTGPIVSNPQATTKEYVDLAVSVGAPPLQLVQYATGAVLPDAPVYASPAQTLTSTVMAALVVDTVAVSVGNRILVKDQADNRENGVYVVTVAGSGASFWVLTRASDFDQAVVPIVGGTSVFVDFSVGTHSGHTYSLQSAVTQVDPLFSAVVWVQIGGVPAVTEGLGIDLIGSQVNVDASAQFSFPANVLTLNTLAIVDGGTGTASFTTGDRVVATNLANNALISTALVPSTVTTETNTQTFQSKTFEPDVTGNVLRLDGVDFSTAGSAVAGRVLTVVGGTAQWATPAGGGVGVYRRTINVAQVGGDYATIGAALVDINGGTIAGGVPTTTNRVVIRVHPGTYTETNPVVVPKYVDIRGVGGMYECVIVPTSAVLNVFELSTESLMSDLSVIGPTAGSAYYISHAPAPTEQLVELHRCLARNTTRGFYTSGTGVAGSSQATLTHCAVYCSPGESMAIAFLADGSSRMVCNEPRVRGNSASATAITTCFLASGVGTVQSISDCDIEYFNVGFYVFGAAEQRLMSCNLRKFAGLGLRAGAGGTLRLNGILIDDDRATYPAQFHILADPGATLVQGTSVVYQLDLGSVDPSVPILGSALGLAPFETRNYFVGDVSVGYPRRGFTTSMGGGGRHNVRVNVFQYNASTALFGTDQILKVRYRDDGNTLAAFPSNTVGDVLYIGAFTGFVRPTGMVLKIDTGASPTSGRDNGTTEPPTYRWAWEFWDGAVWRPLRYMASDEDGGHTPRRRDIFNVGTVNVRFDNITSAKTSFKTGGTTFVSSNANAARWVTSNTAYGNWTQSTVNGVTAFWVRCRLLVALATVPVIDQLFVHTNSTISFDDGYNEYFGAARSITPILHAFGDWVSSTDTPANINTILGDNLDLIRTNNRFDVAVPNRICTVLSLPAWADTSTPALLRWSFTPSNTNANFVQWAVRWGYSTPYEYNTSAVSTVYTAVVSAPTEAQTEQSIVFNENMPGVADIQVVSWMRLDLSDMVASRGQEYSGDTLWVSFERAGNVDTYTGRVQLHTIELFAHRMCDGHYLV